MKLFVRLLCLVIVGALAGPFFIKGPDGRPLWTVDDTLRRLKRALPDTSSGNVLQDVSGLGNNEVMVYRWQDADGTWHFAAEAPDGVMAETMVIDTRTNAMLAMRPDTTPAEGVYADNEPQQMTSPMIGPYPSPEATRELIEDVKAIEALSEQRLKQLEQVR